MHYYNFHIGDYASHTRHLSPIEDIAYRRMLDYYYLHEQPIQAEHVARKIGMKEYAEDVLIVLDEFFEKTDEGYINRRADAEIQQYNGFKEAGKRGAAKRWGQGAEKPEDSPPNREGNAPPKQGPMPTITHNPLPNNHKPIIEEDKSSSSSDVPPEADKPPKKPLPKTFLESEFKDEAYKFADWFRTITVETVKFDRDAWAQVWDQLRRIDNRDNVEEMLRAIQWARGDPFWSTNFYSPLKLRERDKQKMMYIDVFLEKMMNSKQQSNGTGSTTATKKGVSLDEYRSTLDWIKQHPGLRHRNE